MAMRSRFSAVASWLVRLSRRGAAVAFVALLLGTTTVLSDVLPTPAQIPLTLQPSDGQGDSPLVP